MVTWKRIWLFALFAGMSIPVMAATLEVGAGKTHTTINDALGVAGDGDVIEVFTGNYSERFDWSKNVSIVEASGETAVLDVTDSIDTTTTNGTYLLNITGLPAGADAVWEGIDILYDSNKFLRIIEASSNPADSLITFRDMDITDTSNAGSNGNIVNVASSHLQLENMNIDMTQAGRSGPNGEGWFGYWVGFGVTGADGEQTSLVAENVDLAVKGNYGMFTVHPSAMVTLNNCSLNRVTSGFPAFLTDLFDGTCIFNDCTLTGGADTVRLILTRFGNDPIDLTFNRCVFDGITAGGPFGASIEKAADADFENCAFHVNAGKFPIDLTNSTLAGGNNVTMSVQHCTFVSPDESANNTGIRNRAASGATCDVEVNNNIFSITGSTRGAIYDNNQGGTVNINAGTNLRWVGTSGDSGAATENLTGTVIDADPLLQADMIHLTEYSPALGQGEDLGVTDDIDGGDRPLPLASNPDLGADENYLVPVELSEFVVE